VRPSIVCNKRGNELPDVDAPIVLQVNHASELL